MVWALRWCWVEVSLTVAKPDLMEFPRTPLFLPLYSSGRATQAGPEFRLEVSWRIWQVVPRADAFPVPWPRQFTRFIISSIRGWLSSICLCLWSDPHRESSNDVCCDHVCWTCSVPVWCPYSSPVLIDCTYPGLSVNTVPNAHTSSGMLGFYASRRLTFLLVSPHLYRQHSKQSFLKKAVLVCYTCLITDRFTHIGAISWKLSDPGVW